MKKILLAVLLSVFLINSVFAYTFISIFVDESGRAVFLGQSDEELLDLPEGISYENGEIQGVNSALTSKNGDLWTFSFSLENSEINVVFPDGAVLKDFEQGEVFLQSGKISVSYFDSNTITYTIEPIENSVSSVNIPLLAILIGLFIVLVVFVINYNKREKKETKDNLEIIKQVLSDRDKVIVDKLKEVGKIKSSFLRREVDMPKASFSRHIHELEKKGIVKRTGEGRNKFVELN